MDSWWYAWAVAEIYTALGDKDKAINALEVAYKLRGDFVPFMHSYCLFKPLFDDSRFKAMESRLNYPK